MITRSKVFFAAESLLAGNGGICRVARLMARVLNDELVAPHVTVLSLSDTTPAGDVGVSADTAKGSRGRFIYKVHRAALTHSHFVYDFLGMARAHCRFPPLRKPFMSWIHGTEVWEQAPANRIRWARSADLLVVNSAYTRARADRVYGNFDRAKLCWLATESDDLPARTQRFDGPPTVLIVARLEERGKYKGHAELIDCWPTVVSAVPDARLLVVGRGHGLQYLRQKAIAAGVGENIVFSGFVPDGAMNTVWRESDVLAMPSRVEGFGLVYIEAMRHGLPIVASVHDAAPEINLENETGYNIDLDKPEELPERLIYLLKNRDVAEKLGGNGQSRWAAHFRYSAFRQRFTPLLKEFLAA